MRKFSFAVFIAIYAIVVSCSSEHEKNFTKIVKYIETHQCRVCPDQMAFTDIDSSYNQITIIREDEVPKEVFVIISFEKGGIVWYSITKEGISLITELFNTSSASQKQMENSYKRLLNKVNAEVEEKDKK
jgi:hypothetical protein